MAITSVTKDTDAIWYVEDGVTRKKSVSGRDIVISFPISSCDRILNIWRQQSDGHLLVTYVDSNGDDQTVDVDPTGGTTDHGALTGLSDDDHSQYWNDTRGDAAIATHAADTSTHGVSVVGDVKGPSSATDNTIARYDGVTGKIIQGSTVTIDDSGNILIGAYSLKTTNILVKEESATFLAIRNAADNGYLGLKTGALTAGNTISITGQQELRFYYGTYYVGFEPPALSGNQIWVLPDADGSAGDYIKTDGVGNLSWDTPAGGGDVTAAANMVDNTLIKGDGGGKGVQDTGITVDDSDNMNMNGGTITNAGHGIADNQVLTVDQADAASGEFPQFTANGLQSLSEAEFKAAANLEIGTDVLAQQTVGIADDNLVEMDDADAAANDYCKLTANGIEGRSYAEVKTDLSLDNVENTALSTWAGSANITAIGTLASGNADAAVSAASDSTPGKVELATIAETNTGTDATRAVTPDGLAGSDYGKRPLFIKLIDDATALGTGDGAFIFVVPALLNGWNLVGVEAHVTMVSSSGTPTYSIYNLTDSQDMLSTSITIDANEYTSATAATAAVINTSYDDVATGDRIEINKDVAGTGEKGDEVILIFQLP